MTQHTIHDNTCATILSYLSIVIIISNHNLYTVGAKAKRADDPLTEMILKAKGLSVVHDTYGIQCHAFA